MIAYTLNLTRVNISNGYVLYITFMWKKQQDKNFNLLYVNLINNCFIHIFTETPKTEAQHMREQC